MFGKRRGIRVNSAPAVASTIMASSMPSPIENASDYSIVPETPGVLTGMSTEYEVVSGSGDSGLWTEPEDEV